MYINIIDTENKFDEIKNIWMSFEKKINNRNISSSYIWQRTWWKYFKNYENLKFGYNKKLCILLLYDKDNMLKAIAPFCELTRKIYFLNFKTIEFISSQWGGTYIDILSNKLSKEEFNFIFNWLKNNKKYDLIILRYIPEFSSNINNINRNDFTIMSACPEINISNFKNMEYYRQKEYSKSLKQNFRTSKNRMNKDDINYKEDIVKNFKYFDYTDIKNISKSKLIDNKGCVYENSRIEAFLKNIYFNKEFPNNVVKILFNNKLVCYRINFLYNNCKYCFDASYDRNYRHYDLGALSVDLNINDSFEKNYYIHCMGAGMDFYKLKGNTLTAPLYYVIARWYGRRTEKKFNKELKRNFKKFNTKLERN
jgi:hypothetical protein